MDIMGILPTKHSFRTLVAEIMDLPDIIHRNNNYVENLHATGNNENRNIIFMQQFYKHKQLSSITSKQKDYHCRESNQRNYFFIRINYHEVR